MQRKTDDKIYTRSDIKLWQTKIEETIPARLQAHKLAIEKINAELRLLQENVAELTDVKIREVKRTITALDAQIQAIKLPAEIVELNIQIEQCEAERVNFQAQIDELASHLAAIDLALFQAEIERLQNLILKLVNDESSVKDKISSLEQQHQIISANIQRDEISMQALKKNKNSSGGNEVDISRLESQESLNRGNLRTLDSTLRIEHAILKRVQKEKSIHNDEINLLSAKIPDCKIKITRIYTEQELQLRNKEKLQPQSLQLTESLAALKEKTSSLREKKSRLERLLQDAKERLAPLAPSELDQISAQNLKMTNEIKLGNLEGQKESALQKIIACQNQAQLQQKELNKLELKQQALQQNDFIAQYLYQPDKLTTELIALLQAEVATYELHHPAQQVLSVRAALIELPQKINFIISQPGSTLELARLKYFQVLGLINAIRTRTQDDNLVFGLALQRVLQRQPVNIDEINPNEYQQLREVYIDELADLNSRQVNEIEVARYNEAIRAFEELLAGPLVINTREMQNLRKAGIGLLNAIKADKLSADKSSTDMFDLKLNINTLKTAFGLFGQPQDVKLQEQLAVLVRTNQSGKPNRGMQVRGALLMFVGAVVAAASALLGVAMLGIVSPLAIAGMAVGGGVFILGSAALIYGRQKGVDKALTTYQHASFFRQPQSTEASATSLPLQPAVSLVR